MLHTTQQDEMLPGIQRKDVLKCETLGQARETLNHFHSLRFIFLGDHDDPKPFWVVEAKTATKLEKMGYERA